MTKVESIHVERLQAEVDMLRGVGCLEDGDGPCGVCIKCLRLRAEQAERERDEARSLLAQYELVMTQDDKVTVARVQALEAEKYAALVKAEQDYLNETEKLAARINALEAALDEAIRTCAACRGTGLVWQTYDGQHAEADPKQVPCSRCARLRAVRAGSA